MSDMTPAAEAPETQQPAQAPNPQDAENQTTPAAEAKPETPPRTPEAEEAEAERKRQMYALRQLAKAAKAGRETGHQAQHIERELQAERAARAQLEARLQQLEGPKEPRVDEFQTYDEYTRAMVRYELAKAAPPQAQTHQQPQVDPREILAHQEQEQRYGHAVQSVLAETVQKYPDLAAFNPGVEMPDFRQYNPAVIQGIFQSEAKHEVINHVFRNPDVAWKLAAMTPQQTYKELGRIEALIANGRVTTKAPPPPSTVGGGGSASSGLTDDLSDSEWIRRRNLQVSRKGR